MLKKRLALNFGANVFNQFAYVVLVLGSVPLFLAFWSKERYGAWLLLSAVPSYLGLAEAGFATSSANEVSMAVAQGDWAKALRSLHTTWGFIAGICSILLALTVVVFFAVPWRVWPRFSQATPNEVRWTVTFLNIYTVGAILIGMMDPVYRASYKYVRYTIIHTFGRLLEMPAIGLALAYGHSMIWVSVAMLSVRWGAFLVLFIDSKMFSPSLHLGLSGFSMVELKRVWRPSTMFMANALGNALYFQGLTLVVGATLGTAAVVVYNSTRTLTRVIVNFVGIIRQAAWPEFSYLYGAGDLGRARRLNELVFEAAGVSSLVLAALIFGAASWIMPLWTHHAVKIDPPLLMIFLTSATLNGFWSVTLGFLMGTNHHEGITVRYLIAASIALVLALAIAPVGGIYGIALVMVLCELVLLPYAISQTCSLLGQSWKEFIAGSIQLLAVRQELGDYSRRRLAKAQ